MSKKVEQRFSIFPACEFSTKNYAVVIHPTAEALTRQYRRWLQEAGQESDRVRTNARDPLAFFVAVPSDSLCLGELHFHEQNLHPSLLAHEAAHATVEWMRRTNAPDHTVLFENGRVEEVFATVLENILAQLLDVTRLL